MSIALLLALNACHWIGDYTHASRPWMLAAKKFGKPTGPILIHASVHAALMFLACWALVGFGAGAIAFAIQLPTHFGIDVLKGRMNGWFPSLQNPANYFHWWVFGADQFAHQAVIIWITWATTP